MSVDAAQEVRVVRDDGRRSVELEPGSVFLILTVCDDERGAVGIRARGVGEPRRIDDERERYVRTESFDRARDEAVLGKGLARVALLQGGKGPLGVEPRGADEEFFAPRPDDVEGVVLRG